MIDILWVPSSVTGAYGNRPAPMCHFYYSYKVVKPVGAF